MKTTMAAIAAMLVGTAALMAQDDIVVTKKINVFDRVQVAQDTIQVVMELPRELEHGVWDMSASATLFLRGKEGTTVFFVGAVVQREPEIDFNDATITIGSAVIHSGRADSTVALVGRDLDIDPPPGGTVPVYMVMWIHTDNPADLNNAEIYGFVRARKIPGT